jgi:hypothetical protein
MLNYELLPREEPIRHDRWACTECGTKIVIWFHNRRAFGCDSEHQLCRRCWRALINRTRARSPPKC